MRKYWDKVEIGHSLNANPQPPISRTQIAQFAAASNDCSPLHLDDDFAKEAGFSSAFASGLICLALVEEALRSFADNMSIVTLSGTFQRLIWPGDTLTAKGVILRRYQKNGELRVQFSVWCENQNEEVVMKGHSFCSLFKNSQEEEKHQGSLPAVSTTSRQALVKKCAELIKNAELSSTRMHGAELRQKDPV